MGETLASLRTAPGSPRVVPGAGLSTPRRRTQERARSAPQVGEVDPALLGGGCESAGQVQRVLQQRRLYGRFLPHVAQDRRFGPGAMTGSAMPSHPDPSSSAVAAFLLAQRHQCVDAVRPGVLPNPSDTICDSRAIARFSHRGPTPPEGEDLDHARPALWCQQGASTLSVGVARRSSVRRATGSGAAHVKRNRGPDSCVTQVRTHQLDRG